MEVLILVWSIQIGGAETFAVNLARHFGKSGLKPFLFPISDILDYTYVRHLHKEGITIISPFINPIGNFVAWKINSILKHLRLGNFREKLVKKKFEAFVKKHNVRLILSNAYASDNFLAQYDKRSIPPYIVVEHGEYSYSIFDKKEINLKGISAAALVVCVSEWCKLTLATAIDVPTSVILNGHTGAPGSREGDLPGIVRNDKFVFGMIGRSVDFKGWEEAIQAFNIVRRDHKDVRLLLIGNGPVHERLREQHGNDESISFAGKVNNPDELLREIDVGLVPSRRYEAFGIVLLDFFSCGIPVVATHVGGIPEVVGVGEHSGGVLIPTNSSGSADPTVLAEAMSKFVSDKKFYEKKSRGAREIYREFSFDKVGLQYEILIKSIVNGGVNNNSQL